MSEERRAEDQLTPFFSNDPASDVVKLMRAYDEAMERLTTLREWVQDQHEVADADGDQLDYLGTMIGCARLLNEEDAEYRARLQQHITSFQGAGTKGSIKQFFSLYLDIEEAAITIDEAFEDVIYWDDGYFWGDDTTSEEDLNYWTSDAAVSGVFTVTIELTTAKYYTWNTITGRNRLQALLDDVKAAGTIGRVVLVDIVDEGGWRSNKSCRITVTPVRDDQDCQIKVYGKGVESQVCQIEVTS